MLSEHLLFLQSLSTPTSVQCCHLLTASTSRSTVIDDYVLLTLLLL